MLFKKLHFADGAAANGGPGVVILDARFLGRGQTSTQSAAAGRTPTRVWEQ